MKFTKASIAILCVTVPLIKESINIILSRGFWGEMQDKDQVPRTDCKCAYPLGTQEKKSNSVEIFTGQPGKKDHQKEEEQIGQPTAPKSLKSIVEHLPNLCLMLSKGGEVNEWLILSLTCSDILWFLFDFINESKHYSYLLWPITRLFFNDRPLSRNCHSFPMMFIFSKFLELPEIPSKNSGYHSTNFISIFFNLQFPPSTLNPSLPPFLKKSLLRWNW